jgi:hypothetical protein
MKEFWSIQIGLTKAYDRVDWIFLEGALRWLGFHSKWIRWVMQCVTTVQYSVRFNNVPLESFKPLRELRQGDPLSPYLFLVVADGLLRLLQHEVGQGTLHDLHVCRRAPGISHLLFVDDTLLFLEAKRDQVKIIQGVVRKYERITGQLINLAKCSLMFGAACSAEDRDHMMEVLQVVNVAEEEKYLGLPTPRGRMSKDKFKSTKKRLSKRCNSWAERFMSSGVKEFLIKSVAQAIPRYVMGVFKLPAMLCEELSQMIRYFWRGEDGDSVRSIGWLGKSL